VAAKNATATIPIVFAGLGDPVAIGLVANIAQPGGNVTGISNVTGELVPQLLDLLSELVPQAAVIALLISPNNSNHEGLARNAQQAARSEGYNSLS
jgi:putative ABC transport system substrate-binding protein